MKRVPPTLALAVALSTLALSSTVNAAEVRVTVLDTRVKRSGDAGLGAVIADLLIGSIGRLKGVSPLSSDDALAFLEGE